MVKCLLRLSTASPMNSVNENTTFNTWPQRRAFTWWQVKNSTYIFVIIF